MSHAHPGTVSGISEIVWGQWTVFGNTKDNLGDNGQFFGNFRDSLGEDEQFLGISETV